MMKYNIQHIMLVSGISALLCACTTSDDAVINNIDSTVNASAVEAICMPSDQPIVMTAGNANSGILPKSFVDQDEQGNFNVSSMGVFMLATGYTPENTTHIPTINWSGGKNAQTVTNANYVKDWVNIYHKGIDVWSVYYDLNNAVASATMTSTGTNITLYDNTAKTVVKQPYYPMGNYHTYSFYAYAPWTKNENISYSKDKVVAAIPVDGTQDVIWGKAEGAYCANYYRDPANRDDNDNPLPVNLQFEHKFVAVNFNITPGGVPAEDGTMDYSKACSVRVDAIAVVNCPKTVGVSMADGTLTGLSDVSGVYYARKSDTELIDAIQPTLKEDGTPDVISVKDQGVLMPPPSTGINYKLMMLVSYDDGTGNMVQNRLVYPLAALLPSSWKAGEKGHTLTLTIYHPEDIAAFGASLTNWVIEEDEVVVQ